MLTIGPLTIDFTPFLAVSDSPIAAAWFLLANGGWVIVLAVFLWMAKILWYETIQMQFLQRELRPVLLAIDVPKRSIQTAKAVENIFAHLAGAHGTHNRREHHLQGKVQEWFSLEMVSIDGYVQYLVWTWDKYRDLVETAIYAQYPDSQITEVEDYTKDIPKQYPDPNTYADPKNEAWELWGTEFVLVKDQAYPLRTWEAFEHQGQKDEAFKDPLAAMMENLARLVPGEQIWLQFLIRPIEQKKWQEKSNKVMKKLIGAKMEHKKTMMDKTLGVAGAVATPILQQVLGSGAEAPKQKKDEPLSKMLFLSPGERATAEAIELKSAKIGFDVKIRVVYVARKAVFKKQHGAHAVIGAIKQFNTNDMNALKPDFKNVGPSSLWLFKDRRNNWRKTKLARAYSKRSMYIGIRPYVLNIEELASLWHFPTEAVHAPLIMRTDAKRAVPPSGLPVERAVPALRVVPPKGGAPGGGVAGGAPQGLPVV